jgi:hypothetical protein
MGKYFSGRGKYPLTFGYVTAIYIRADPPPLRQPTLGDLRPLSALRF